MNELISEKGWIQIFINPIYLLIIMLGLLCIGYIIGKNKKVYKNKGLSIIIYLFTFAGIFSMTYDNRNFILDIDENILQQRIEIDFQREFLNRLDWLESYLSVPFVRSERSPQNFDEIQKERRVFFNWILTHSKYIKNNVTNLEFIKEDSLQYPYTQINDTSNLQDLEYIKYNVTNYNSYLSRLKNIRKHVNKNEFEIVFSFIYPLLFTIGLSLQIIKELFLTKD